MVPYSVSTQLDMCPSFWNGNQGFQVPISFKAQSWGICSYRESCLNYWRFSNWAGRLWLTGDHEAWQRPILGNVLRNTLIAWGMCLKRVWATCPVLD
jgi:hypothetical protein